MSVLTRFTALSLELALLRATECQCGHRFAAHSVVNAVQYADSVPCRGTWQKKCRCKGWAEVEQLAFGEKK